MVYYFTKIFVYLTVIVAVCYFSVYKLTRWTQQRFTCSKSIVKTLEKRCEICPKLTLDTVESCSGVFIVNFEHISHFFSVSIVDFDWVNVCWGALSCVNIITQSLGMS